jgi:hypothetical protein
MEGFFQDMALSANVVGALARQKCVSPGVIRDA